MPITIKKSRGKKQRVETKAGNGEHLSQSEPLDTKYGAMVHAVSMHRTWRDPSTVVTFLDGSSMTLAEMEAEIDAQRAAAAEKKYH